MMPLALLRPGSWGEIISTDSCEGTCGGGCGCASSGSHGHHHGASGVRAEEMGLRVGKKVEMLEKNGHLLLLKVDETRVALHRSLAKHIKVREVAA